jgi:hypothetical protein
MKRAAVVLAALIGLVPMPRTSFAQAMTLTGETKTVTATVEAIESASRTLTLKMPDGTFLNSTAPAKLQRFSEIRVGDQITTRYYENLVFRLKKPGEKDVNSVASASTPAGVGPTGTVAKQRTITATITAIDRGVPSMTFSGPNGWKYSSKVQDQAFLTGCNVGDKVDITWTDALLVEFDKPARK